VFIKYDDLCNKIELKNNH